MNINEVQLFITNCIQCQHHKVVDDPDINDWFCDDDKAVMCTLSSKKPERWTNGINYKIGNPMITVGCRPYQLEEECTPIPDWCPLRTQRPMEFIESKTDIKKKSNLITSKAVQSIDKLSETSTNQSDILEEVDIKLIGTPEVTGNILALLTYIATLSSEKKNETFTIQFEGQMPSNNFSVRMLFPEKDGSEQLLIEKWKEYFNKGQFIDNFMFD